jgi:hypothetical protein
MPNADESDRQTQTDTKTHVKIKIVGKYRINGFHPGMPAGKNSVFIKDRIGDHCNDDAN